ncbi:hypothetical protein CUJ84_Chr000083 [Rhizobium leguminosarum]|uniref:Uncharacterized protein n=1 Tax=Rhizobium leguminosarum TaxID=384 RepID=A0A2K9YX16_RHILE|nr:hypothetical protein CUJ84_Chr000083 [Rhizobium leguminosarum]
MSPQENAARRRLALMAAPHPNPLPVKNGERGRAMRERVGTERARHVPSPRLRGEGGGSRMRGWCRQSPGPRMTPSRE